MAIFLITPIESTGRVAASVQEKFPDDFYKISGSDSLLVHSTGTTKELADKLGISAGSEAIVVGISSYYGFAPSDIWEWMQSRMGSD